MKVLADSCVWSYALRRKNKLTLIPAQNEAMHALGEAIRDGHVVLMGPIRQEVLSGVKQVEQFEKLRAALDSFPDESIATEDYVNAARLFNRCRSKGIECGPVDILICAVALANRWEVLTTDEGLLECLAICRSSVP